MATAQPSRELIDKIRSMSPSKVRELAGLMDEMAGALSNHPVVAAKFRRNGHKFRVIAEIKEARYGRHGQD